MDRNFNHIFKSYCSTHKKDMLALNGWLILKDKKFSLKNAFKCIYDYAKGNINTITDIIRHLTAKRKVYGRTQVYNDLIPAKTDITYDDSGVLRLRGYNANDNISFKGQHLPKNPKIFRKTDDQVSKIYQHEEERLLDIGHTIRQLYPDYGKMLIEIAIEAVKEYARKRKKSVYWVLDRLKSGYLTLDEDDFTVKIADTPHKTSNTNERKTIIIKNDVAYIIAEKLEMSEYKFFNNIKSFLKSLLEDPINAAVPLLLKKYGINKSLLLREMLNMNIIEKSEKISDKDENGKPKTATMMIKYKVPKKNFDRNLKKLYIRLFEKNLPPRKMKNEDGATGCDASGQYSQPLFGVQRRTMADVIEATATSNVGNYQYDVPFIGDKESMARKNGVGGSISINKI